MTISRLQKEIACVEKKLLGSEMKERFFQYILRIFSDIYNSKVFIFFIFFYYVTIIVEVVTFWRIEFVKN